MSGDLLSELKDLGFDCCTLFAATDPLHMIGSWSGHSGQTERSCTGPWSISRWLDPYTQCRYSNCDVLQICQAVLAIKRAFLNWTHAKWSIDEIWTVCKTVNRTQPKLNLNCPICGNSGPQTIQQKSSNDAIMRTDHWLSPLKSSTNTDWVKEKEREKLNIYHNWSCELLGRQWCANPRSWPWSHATSVVHRLSGYFQETPYSNPP